MIQHLELEQFTVFQHVRFEFGKHINVFHGENGTGKTHVLKVLYSELHGTFDVSGPPEDADARIWHHTTTKSLQDIFQIPDLRPLVRVPHSKDRQTAIAVGGQEFRSEIPGRIPSSRFADVFLADPGPKEHASRSVFVPTRELLSIYRGFVSLYDNVAVPFERTWRDTCSLLGRPLLRGPALAAIQSLLDPLEHELGGKVILTGGDELAIERPDGTTLSAHMEAEGRRKLAMLVRLIANGSITPGSALFWDEPEANLNPVLIKKIAAILFSLSRAGIQIFIATHSLFLMREIHVLQGYAAEKLDIRYFGLHREAGEVTVQQGPDIADSGDVAALDEELLQSERYMDLAMGLPAPKPASEAT